MGTSIRSSQGERLVRRHMSVAAARDSGLACRDVGTETGAVVAYDRRSARSVRREHHIVIAIVQAPPGRVAAPGIAKTTSAAAA